MITSQPAKPGQKYLVIGPNCWGRADTLQEAIANCKQNFSKSLFGTFKYIAFIASEEVEIDGMGGFCYPMPASPDAPKPYTELFRYNFKEG